MTLSVTPSKVKLLRIAQASENALYGIITAVGISSVAGGFAVVAYQVSIWLSDGYWRGYSLYTVVDAGLRMISPESIQRVEARAAIVRWFYEPQSWYGLHKFIIGTLEFFPVSLLLIAVGILIVVAVSGESSSEKRDRAIAAALGFRNPGLTEPASLRVREHVWADGGSLPDGTVYEARLLITEVSSESVEIKLGISKTFALPLHEEVSVSVPRMLDRLVEACPPFESSIGKFPAMFIALIRLYRDDDEGITKGVFAVGPIFEVPGHPLLDRDTA